MPVMTGALTAGLRSLGRRFFRRLAFIAAAVKNYHMLADAEAGRQVVHIGVYAAVDLVELAAFLAVEMVMVMLAGQLVAGSLAGEIDGLKYAFFGEIFDASVNGGDAQGRQKDLGFFSYFLRGQRTSGFFNHLADVFALLSVPTVVFFQDSTSLLVFGLQARPPVLPGRAPLLLRQRLWHYVWPKGDRRRTSDRRK